MTESSRRPDPLHLLFDAGLAAKGGLAAIEAGAGLVLLWLHHGVLVDLVHGLAGLRLFEGRHEFLAAHLARFAAGFDISTQHFYAIYLLGHGLVKLAIVAALVRRILVAYPIAIVVFTGFIGYQMLRWTHTHSVMMIALSATDLIVIVLTWREWRIRVREKDRHSAA